MREIRLQNYQSHKDTIVALAPTITALTGKSDQGKSSVIRAVETARTNKPGRGTFVRKGEDKSIVTVDNVRHERTKSTSKYYIEGKKDPYKALWGGVPEEITNTLNIGKVNIQKQIRESVFLLDSSPGKVAKELSKLVDLESTTKALAFIKTKKRGHSSNVDGFNKLIEDTELQLSNLEHVNDADEELIQLERKGGAIQKLREKRTQLYVTHENATQAEYELSRIPSTNALKPAKQIQKHYEDLQILMKQHARLEDVTQEIVSLDYLLSFDPTKLLKKAKRLNKLKDKLERLAKAHLNAESYQIKIETLEKKEAKLKEIKDKILKDRCPLCGRGDE